MSRALLPNSTQIPDVILDFWLSELTGAELKVVLYVARRTYGFGKESDTISLNQMAEGIRRRDGSVLDRGTGLSRSTVKTVCAGLVTRGILLKRTNVSEKTGEFEESTYSLNLDWTFSEGETGPEGGVGRKSAQVGQKCNQGVGRNLAQCGPEITPGVGRKSASQETAIQETAIQETAIQETAIQETVQETAAGEEAAALISELIGHHVNRVDAERLVRAKPEECRRQLEYLAYLSPRKNPARWLVSAIKGEYGPPDGLVSKQASEHEEKEFRERNERRAALEMARIRHEETHSEEFLVYLRERVGIIKISQPEAFTAFLAKEKKRVEMYRQLERGEEHLRVFENEKAYLFRFQEYFRSIRGSEVLSFWEWDAKINRRSFNRQPIKSMAESEIRASF